MAAVTLNADTIAAAIPTSPQLLLRRPQLCLCLSRYYLRRRHITAIVPAVYYGPAYYVAYNPWPAPVATAGLGRLPWYGYYGGYFAPAPVYPTSTLAY